MSSFLTRGRVKSAVSADELNGCRRDRCTLLGASDSGRVGGEACPYYGSVGLIPVVGILALVGYALETARNCMGASMLVKAERP